MRAIRTRTLAFSAMLMFSNAATVTAQQSDDELMELWYYYDDHRSDMSKLIEARHNIGSAEATFAYARDDYARKEKLLLREAVSEDEFKMAQKDRDVAAAEVEFAHKHLEIMRLRAAISDLRWRWHRGEERNVPVLEDLQFRLWNNQCDAVEIKSKRELAEVGYAEYRVQILKNLQARGATTISELHEAQTELAVKENNFNASKESFRACKNGPPFDRIYKPGASANHLFP